MSLSTYSNIYDRLPPLNSHKLLAPLVYQHLQSWLVTFGDGRFGSQVGQIGPQIGQIRDFFRSDFSTYWLETLRAKMYLNQI